VLAQAGSAAGTEYGALKAATPEHYSKTASRLELMAPIGARRRAGAARPPGASLGAPRPPFLWRRSSPPAAARRAGSCVQRWGAAQPRLHAAAQRRDAAWQRGCAALVP